MLYTGLNALTVKVQSLEDKYVRFLYKQVQALKKCNSCNLQPGKQEIHLITNVNLENEGIFTCYVNKSEDI